MSRNLYYWRVRFANLPGDAFGPSGIRSLPGQKWMSHGADRCSDRGKGMNPPEPQVRRRVARIRAVYLEALAADPQARQSLLDRRCGSDPKLRRVVEKLLQPGVEADAYLADLARRARVPLAAWAEAAPLEGRHLGAYRLIRELGHGGMGIVYLAERADERFEKQVAVKLLPLGLRTIAGRERFLSERRVLAKLEHQGISRLLDAGVTDDGVPYFVMEYVEGQPITGYCDGAASSIDERLGLFLQVCDAVAYAHRHHVLHRDLKPANILVTPEGTTKLLDFGIAKVLDDDPDVASTLTSWGGRPLTPAFASPEQIAGDPIGFTSDVYQLGVLLYQLVSGRTPFSLADLTPTEARRVILEKLPPAPSEAAGGAPAEQQGGEAAELARRRGCSPDGLQLRLRGDLDRVVLKALEKDPDHRYPSVKAFAADVRRHLEGRRVLARRRSRFVRFRGAPIQLATTAPTLAAAVVITAVGAFGLWNWDRSRLLPSEAGVFAPGLPEPPGMEATSTRSVVAFNFYREGLRAHYRGAPSVAYPLFSAAVREDSTFAMAWYHLGHSTPYPRDRYPYMDRARRLAREFGSDRERLLISAAWAEWMADPSLWALADTLAARYPSEVDGHFFLGVGHVWRGEFLAAMPHFERVVQMDSASLGRTSGHCRACDALGRIVSAYVGADSLSAAERAARRWVRLQPASATAWQELAWTLWRQERGEEAMAARREAIRRRSATGADQIYPAVVAIRLGDYSEADVLLTERIRNGTPEVQRAALWWQTLSFRYQRRLGEALASAQRYRSLLEAEGDSESLWGYVSLQAQVLFEMGRFPESSALMDSAAAEPFGGLSSARDARHRLWVLAHASTVAMAAGNVAYARILADTIEVLGRETGNIRDRSLHQYVRGMLSVHDGDLEGAVEGFREVTASNQFARGTLELARLLIAMGEAEEAVAMLQRTLRGPIFADGFYVTRPELHELLGDAWAAAGRPDSAAVNYQRAIAAWEHADPAFQAQRAATERRLSALAW
jgi:serine/threonine protein kinase/tetratricopeptide (TPR) repeat protein